MKRRKFIQTSSAVSVPIVLGGMPLKAVGRNALSNLINDDNDRVLVLINLAGGNDGLTTVIPLDYYSELNAVRANVLVPENSILEVAKDNGFHPSMGGLKNVWDQGKLNIVQSVGYPNQNRSHFRSTDIWQTASDSDEYLTTGWLGRYFDQIHPGYPQGYPNTENPDPFALTIGNVISETCQGNQSTFSLALVDPANPGSVNLGEEGSAPDNCYGMELTYVREVAKQSNAYAEVIKQANDMGGNLSSKYTIGGQLSEKLKIVARLISGGLRTKVYVVQLGGFDLHSGQVDPNDPTIGRQTNLLTELSTAIEAFQEDMSLMGLEKRVVGMTYSEFGRQIKSNQSDGTDHGTAAPLFVFGSCVNPDIIGENPEIDTQVEDQAGLPMQYDFRSIYGTILVDWFGVDEDAVRDILYRDFQRLPLIEGCDFSTSTDDSLSTDLIISAYPNPCTDILKIDLTATGERMRLSLFDTRGAEIKVISGRTLAAGKHSLTTEVRQLSKGTYYLRYATGSLQKTVTVIKS